RSPSSNRSHLPAVDCQLIRKANVTPGPVADLRRALRFVGRHDFVRSRPIHRTIADRASADGSVVTGYVVTEDQRSLAAYWTAEDGIKTISDPSTGAYETYVNDVSADGTIIVGATRFETGNLSQKGWMWTEETGLVHLPAPSLGDEELYVYWASAIGVEAGKVTIVGTANDQAVRWVNGGQPEVLGEFNPYDVSDDGSVIVGDGDNGDGQKAAIKWVNGARGVIQDASDERLSVSANGAYIVGHDRPSSSPARWATIFGA